jgi:hypothetical protein
MSALSFKILFINNIITFPFHYLYFSKSILNIREYFITKNFFYSFVYKIDIYYNNQKLDDIWIEWMQDSKFDNLKHKYSVQMSNLYYSLQKANVLDLNLTSSQKEIFLSFCKLFAIPEYDNSGMYIFSKKYMGNSDRIILHNASAYIKNVTNQVSILLHNNTLMERMIFDKNTFNENIEKHLKSKFDNIDDIVAICNIVTYNRIDSIDIYRVGNIIDTNPTYTKLWSANNFIFVRDTGIHTVPYKPWSIVNWNKDIEFRLNGKSYFIPNFKTQELLKSYNDNRGIKSSSYYYIGKNVKIMKVS